MNPQDRSVAAELIMHRKLEEWFSHLVPESHIEDYTVHLGDIYGSMDPLRDAIAALVMIDPNDRTAVRRALLEIDSQIYHHLTDHIEQLRHPLGDLINSLYDEENRSQ